ncbi:ATP-binding protein [Arthrobacter sp. MMS18-M83]|uniref:ATP-binding protein n=1 Tax=Arthrobacter sp. MMS18-M83 TaxID=2996261 RepID=UPI00227BD486|nr:AAA family ATPase [Arthrobacter sp. MMS18-M83]WAH96190.1 AAA family ATPase [Arthrobacter sp. MMS18-M83]
MTSFKPTIDRLRIEAFRGFRDAREFDLSASAVVVTGPNGTGKTSFFDALQWVLLGKIERLEALRSRRNVEHVVNQYRIGVKALVEIDLSLPSGQVMLRRTGDQGGSTLELSQQGGAPLFGEEAEAQLRRIFLPHSELSLHSALTTSGLMQQDVLRSVLEAKPAERYRQLSTVLGLGALEDFEDATKSVAKQAADREGQVRVEHSKLFVALTQAQDRLETAQARLASRPQIDAVRNEVLEKLRATPAGMSLIAANVKLALPDDVRLAATAFGRAADLVDSAHELIRGASQLREGLEDPPSTDTIEALQAAVERATSKKDAAAALRGAAQSALNTARLTAADVAKLAALAVPMLSDNCPVCRQPIDREHVERDLVQRAEATGTLLGLQKSFIERANAFSEASTAASEAAETLAAAEKQAERWRASSAADQAASIAVEALAADVSLVRFDQYSIDFLDSLAVPASEYFRGARRVLHDLLETFDRQNDQNAIERVAAECTSLEAALAAAVVQLATQTARSARLRALAEKTLDARVEVTEKRLRSIQPLVADIFRRLDPHPAFKTVEFELDTYYRRGTTSPLVIDQVAGIAADPLLIFSTSQANIVALSYFIAMSLSMDDSGLPFLLLDDPVQSMDDVNVLGFADLCRHLRGRRQLIVSTHERRLSGLLERKLAPRSEGARTRIIRFTGWDRSGPTVDERDVDGQLLEEPIRVLRRVS